MSHATTEPGLFDCRQAFIAALDDLATRDERIVLLVNDSVSSSNASGFAKRHPSRLLNVGIAEQDMVGIAAGLANGGKVPFVSSASCFLTGRALEQIKADLAYSNANVKLVGQSSGVAYGVLGATHHSIEDLAWTRAIANLTVVVPADPAETDGAVRWAARHVGPVFIRLSRMGVPNVHPDGYRFAPGRAALLRDGRDLTIVACGVMVARALDAAGRLAASGIEARVLNVATIQPLDVGAIEAAARETGAIVTVEEASAFGGLGGAVAEAVVQSHPVPIRILGIRGGFAPAAPIEAIFEANGLTATGVERAAREVVAAKAAR